MKIIKPSFEILTPIDRDFVYKHLERVARTCYKSESAITEQSAPKMVKGLISRQHTAMIEHYSVSVKFFCDRGVSHELVRHRIASFAQESTRYCNYTGEKFGSEITYIDLKGGMDGDPKIRSLDPEKVFAIYEEWLSACEDAERHYNRMMELGASPQIARSVLNNSTKTEIVVTMNLREWIHFFNLRAVGTTGAPHPQMKEITMPLLEAFADALPEVFGAQYEEAIFG